MSFAASKILWTLIQPGNLLLFGLLVASALGLFGGRVGKGRCVGLVAVLALALSLITFLPVGGWAQRILEDRFPRPELPERVDGIIVLGGMVDQVLAAARDEPSLLQSAERLVAFIELGRRYPSARLVFSGGSGILGEQELKEAPVVEAVMEQVGFDTGRVLFESESRNTHENVVLSKARADPKPGERWIVVTSAYHMPRAVGIFRKQDWPVIAYPVDYRTMPAFRRAGIDAAAALGQLGTALHEWIGLVAYRLMGRTDTLFPGP